MEGNYNKRYQLPPPIRQSYPWLMFVHGSDLQRQTFFSISEDRYYTRIIPALAHKVIHCSSNGCLVMQDEESENYFLLDLVSMDIIQLPPVESYYRICILWQSPRDSNCHIWFIKKDGMMSCQPGDHEYVKKQIKLENEEEEDNTTTKEDTDNEDDNDNEDEEESEDDEEDDNNDREDEESEDDEEDDNNDSEDEEESEDDEEDDNNDSEDEEESEDDEEDEESEEDEEDDNFGKYIESAIVIENKMYAILSRGSILVVGDLEDSRIRFRKLTKKPLPWPGPPGTMSCSSYLVESHMELFLVQKIYSNSFLFCQEVIDFEVFRFDSFVSEWVRTQNIGERSIFLNHNGRNRCYDATESGIKANSIYFFKSKDRHLYVFDIKDRSISISLPCSNVSNRYSRLYWI